MIDRDGVIGDGVVGDSVIGALEFLPGDSLVEGYSRPHPSYFYSTGGLYDYIRSRFLPDY